MILKEMTIQNFKGIKEPLKIKFNPITLLFGPNSSGKSSIIQAINYAREIFISGGDANIDRQTKDNRIENLGNYRNITHNHDLNQEIILEFLLEYDGMVYDENRGLRNCLSYFTPKNTVDTSLWRPNYLSYLSDDLKSQLNSMYSMYGYDKLDIEIIQSHLSISDIIDLITTISFKLYIGWNTKTSMPQIKKISSIANGSPLYDISITGSENSNFDKIIVSFYNHPILSQSIINSIKQMGEEYIREEFSYKKKQEWQKMERELQNNMIIELEKEHETYSDPDDWKIQLEKAKNTIDKEADKHNKEWEVKLDTELNRYYKERNAIMDNLTNNDILFNSRIFKHSAMPLFDHLIRKHYELFQIYDIDYPEIVFDMYPKEYDDSLLHMTGDDYYVFNKNLIAALVLNPIKTLRDTFKTLEHIGPLREIPPRNYQPVKYSESFCWNKGLAAYDVLLHPSTTEDFINELNKWLLDKDYLNTGYYIELKRYSLIDEQSLLWTIINKNEEIGDIEKIKEIIKDELIKDIKTQFKIKDKRSDIELLLQDVGTGISQILPIVVGALWLKNKFITIEQPELHIHPAMQSEMGDLLIRSARKNGGNNNFFLVETHSEHLMLRILRRIRETTDEENDKQLYLSPDDVAVYYIKSGENGVNATHIAVNEDGRFDSLWPDGFFAERSKELF